jgi:hypothetical protein
MTRSPSLGNGSRRLVQWRPPHSDCGVSVRAMSALAHALLCATTRRHLSFAPAVAIPATSEPLADPRLAGHQ